MAETRICKMCSVEFVVKHKSNPKIFCTLNCAQRHFSIIKQDKLAKGYLHLTVARELGRPDRCSKCQAVGKVDLANISNKYKRELTDWEWLCRRCHMQSDGRLTEFLSHSNSINKLPVISCLRCSKEVAPSSNKTKFCSRSCSATYINLNSRDYSNRKRRKK